MMQAILLAICLEQGHIVLWTDSTSTSAGAPPGEYICQRCQFIVEIRAVACAVCSEGDTERCL